jgi:hypothetical protein
MNFPGEYPESSWPPELKQEVDRYRRWRWLTLPWSVPFDALAAWIESRKKPAWDDAHYAGWNRRELVWRILFLQGAGRRASVECEVWKLHILPIVALSMFVAGALLGR